MYHSSMPNPISNCSLTTAWHHLTRFRIFYQLKPNKLRQLDLYGTLLPDPCFRLEVGNMHKAPELPAYSVGIPYVSRSPEETREVYTTVGEFDGTRFSYMFDMYPSPPHRCGMHSYSPWKYEPFDPVRGIHCSYLRIDVDQPSSLVVRSCFRMARCIFCYGLLMDT
jgi:hypothetical protein